MLTGSISRGTFKEEELIPKFVKAALQGVRESKLNPSRLARLRIDIRYIQRRMEAKDYFNSDRSAEDLDQLFDILDELSPEGYHFGPHEDAKDDFGFWDKTNKLP